MDRQTKREIIMITLSTFVALPVVAGFGLVVASGLVAW